MKHSLAKTQLWLEEGAAHPSSRVCSTHLPLQGLYLLALNYAAQNVSTVTWAEAGVTKAPVHPPEKWEKNHWAGHLFGLPPPLCGWYQPEFRHHSALTCSVNFPDWNVRTANGGGAEQKWTVILGGGVTRKRLKNGRMRGKYFCLFIVRFGLCMTLGMNHNFLL